jgi:hypothetical protein
MSRELKPLKRETRLSLSSYRKSGGFDEKSKSKI